MSGKLRLHPSPGFAHYVSDVYGVNYDIEDPLLNEYHVVHNKTLNSFLSEMQFDEARVRTKEFLSIII